MLTRSPRLGGLVVGSDEEHGGRSAAGSEWLKHSKSHSWGDAVPVPGVPRRASERQGNVAGRRIIRKERPGTGYIRTKEYA